MSSVNIDTPPLKLILGAIGTVVLLHIVTAIALMMVKAPMPVTQPLEVTPPIEIELITPPTEIEKPVTQVETQSNPQSRPEPITEPKEPVAEEVITEPNISESTPEPTESEIVEPELVEPEIVEPAITPSSEGSLQTPENPGVETSVVQPFEHEVVKTEQPVYDRSYATITPRVDRTTLNNQRRVREAQQNATAQNRVRREAQIAREAARAQAAAQAQAQAQAAREAVEQAAREAAQAKAAREAASNEPVNFTATSADWASIPNFSFPKGPRAKHRTQPGQKLEVVLRMRVNKQGTIENVSVAKSSGNSAVDKAAAEQVQSGRFKPFTQNNVPVVGNVTLPVAYEVPR